jgi:hypothetical protein
MVQNSDSPSQERTATLPSRVERDLRHLTLPGDHELALPGELVEATQAFARAARSQRTRLAYSRAWAGFEAWCRKNGRRALPASPDTVAGWMAALATGNGAPKALARSSINLALSAMIVAQRTAGQPFDRKHPLIQQTWKGICNTKARTETIRKAQPIMGDEVTLMASKASPDESETVIIPRPDMPTASERLEAWALLAGLQPGEPVFRSVDQLQVVAAERLTDRSVSRIVKARVSKHFKANGRTAAEAEKIAMLFSGHSMRAGYATSAAAKDMPSYRIRKHTRHKSPAVLEGYIRAAEQWMKSGPKDVGF